jgi:hypothetical protein
MSVIGAVIEVVRLVTFYLSICLVIIICYNILAYVFRLDFPGKSTKSLIFAFGVLIILLVLDNTIFSIYHVHVFNFKVSLGATPDPLF